MSQQTYPLKCECGIEHAVTGGQAGSTVSCGCGRKVEVPTLGTLKRSVGQSAVSADWEIEHRLKEGSLPIESECLLCGAATGDTLVVRVECERSEVKSDFKWWFWLFPPLALRFLMASMFSSRRDELQGRQVAFRLPVRVCEGCEPQVETVEGYERH